MKHWKLHSFLFISIFVWKFRHIKYTIYFKNCITLEIFIENYYWLLKHKLNQFNIQALAYRGIVCIIEKWIFICSTYLFYDLFWSESLSVLTLWNIRIYVQVRLYSTTCFLVHWCFLDQIMISHKQLKSIRW